MRQTNETDEALHEASNGSALLTVSYTVLPKGSITATFIRTVHVYGLVRLTLTLYEMRFER